MWLTSRRRAALALVLAVPVGWVYLSWSLQTGENAIRSRRGYVICSRTWRDWGNGCDVGSFSASLAWLELVLAGLLVVALAVAAARWVLWPVRGLATTVTRLGPTSLGLRVRMAGPRDEVRRLADAIDQMLDRVAESYESQRRFAANASHELRTPLATQRTLIEVSLADALTPDQLALLSRQLLATNERNENLIEGLLVLAETERGLMSASPLRLDEIVAGSLATMAPLACERGVRLSSDLAPIGVRGERPLLERLVTNLVHNGIKYNNADGTVHVTVFAPAALRVVNTGTTVPPDQVASLFEPFRRQSGERLDHGSGAGLGLTIARSIVAAHGGRIDAAANPDGGLTVDVDLGGQ